MTQEEEIAYLKKQPQRVRGATKQGGGAGKPVAGTSKRDAS